MLLAVSCKTVPDTSELASVSMLIPEDSDVIIKADIDANRELIEPVLALFQDTPEKLTADFLDRTDTVWAGLDLNSGDSRFRSSIVAEGEYPRWIIDFTLFWDPAWKKERFKPVPDQSLVLPYWYEKEGVNQLAFPEKRYMFASSGSMEELLFRYSSDTTVSVPYEWLESERSSDITIMTRNLGPEEYAAFVPQLKRLPIESIILSLKRDEDNYLISGRFYMDSEANAFLFATLFRTMIITAKDRDGNRMFENPREIEIVKDGRDVVLDGMVLSVGEAAAVEQNWLGSLGMQPQKEE